MHHADWSCEIDVIIEYFVETRVGMAKELSYHRVFISEVRQSRNIHGDL